MHNYPNTKISLAESLFLLYIFISFICMHAKFFKILFLISFIYKFVRKIALFITLHKYIVNDVYSFRKNLPRKLEFENIKNNNYEQMKKKKYN